MYDRDVIMLRELGVLWKYDTIFVTYPLNDSPKGQISQNQRREKRCQALFSAHRSSVTFH